MNRNVIQLVRKFFVGQEVTLEKFLEVLSDPSIKEHAADIKVRVADFFATEHVAAPPPMPRRKPQVIDLRARKVLRPVNGRAMAEEMRLFTLQTLSRAKKRKTRREVQNAWSDGTSRQQTGDGQWSSVFSHLKDRGAIRNNGVRTSLCTWKITNSGKQLLGEMKEELKAAVG